MVEFILDLLQTFNIWAREQRDLLVHYFQISINWKVMLPVALLIGPLFSFSKLDALIHIGLSKIGGGKQFIEKSELTRRIDQIIVGTPMWIVLSSLVITPIFSMVYPWKYAVLMLLLVGLKILYGRSYIYDTNIEESSRWWSPVWSRKIGSFTEELSFASGKYAYPSGHTTAMIGACLFLTSGIPALIVLAIGLMFWVIFVNHHWFSDVIGAIALSLAVNSIFKGL